jgi:hypothetical protein
VTPWLNNCTTHFLDHVYERRCRRGARQGVAAAHSGRVSRRH